MVFAYRLGLLTAGPAAGLVLAASLSAQALPSQLGISEPDARESFHGSMTTGYPRWGAAAKAFVALPAAARVAVVRGAARSAAAAWLKELESRS